MSIFRKLIRKFRKAEETKHFEYVEKDTRCDKCEHIEECKENGYLIDITRLADTRQHFIRGIGCNCKLWSDLDEVKTLNDFYKYVGGKIGKKLSEAEKSQIRDLCVVYNKSVYEICEQIGIDCSDLERD